MSRKPLITIIVSSIVVILITCNAHLLTSVFTDTAHGSPCSDNGAAFTAVGTLFSGLGFIALAYTLYQQNTSLHIANNQYKLNLIQNEKEEILFCINNAAKQASDMELRAKGNSEQATAFHDQNCETYSEAVFYQIQDSLERFQKLYEKAETEDEKESALMFLTYEQGRIGQKFVNYAIAVRFAFYAIEKSKLLSTEEKIGYAHYIAGTLTSFDFKILNLLFIRDLYIEMQPQVSLPLSFFKVESARELISGTLIQAKEETIDQALYVMQNLKKLTIQYEPEFRKMHRVLAQSQG